MKLLLYFLIILIFLRFTYSFILPKTSTLSLTQRLAATEILDETSVLQYINQKCQSLQRPLFNSTVVEMKKMSKNELKFFSRTTFNSTNDYFESILREGYNEGNNNPFEVGLVVSLGTSLIFTSVILPFLQLDSSLKNGIGLLFLTLPFLFMGVSTLLPGLIIDLNTRLFQNKGKYDVRDRLCVHEAGHLLVGYLCGYPVLRYQIDKGATGASLTIATTILDRSTIASTAGRLLTISMAGIIAESLHYGDAIGGREDFPIAFQVLNAYSTILPQKLTVTKDGKKVMENALDDEDMNEYFRGAVAKALVLLRLYRDKLDLLAGAISEGRSIYECIDIIEA